MRNLSNLVWDLALLTFFQSLSKSFFALSTLRASSCFVLMIRSNAFSKEIATNRVGDSSVASMSPLVCRLFRMR